MPFIIFFLFLAQILCGTTISNNNGLAQGDYLKWTGVFTSAPQWGAPSVGNSDSVIQGVGTGNIGIFTGQWMPKTLADPWLDPSGSQSSGTGSGYYVLEDYWSNPTGHANMHLQRTRLVQPDPPLIDPNAVFNAQWAQYQNNYGKPIVPTPPPPPCSPNCGNSGGGNGTPPHHSDVPEPGTIGLFVFSGLCLFAIAQIKAPS